jgi:putative N6-adenine-specific DNA methylase
MPTLFLPCPGGVEALLAEEVQRITGTVAETTRGGVWVRRRRAHRDAAQPGKPAGHARAVAAGRWALSRRTRPVRIGPACALGALDHARADAARGRGRHALPAAKPELRRIAHQGRRLRHAARTGRARPSVDTRAPDLPIALFVGPEHATLYVDTSGEALFKRGWREDKGEAPLKETLAAAMLAAAGWQGRAEDGPLLDPCCGAGTIVIEAAQMACGIAPGAMRRFAFERMLPFKPFAAAWRDLQRAAKAAVHAPSVPVFAGDVSFRMTDFATRNAARAGVQQAIEFKTVDALQRLPPGPRGTLMFNPPYGERIAPKGQGTATAREGFEGGGSSAEFFGALAAHWKQHYAGWTAWLLSPDPKLPSLMRLKESRRVPLWNGPIECRLLRFEMTAGAGPGARSAQQR